MPLASNNNGIVLSRVSRGDGYPSPELEARHLVYWPATGRETSGAARRGFPTCHNTVNRMRLVAAAAMWITFSLRIVRMQRASSFIAVPSVIRKAPYTNRCKYGFRHTIRPPQNLSFNIYPIKNVGEAKATSTPSGPTIFHTNSPGNLLRSLNFATIFYDKCFSEPKNLTECPR